MKLEQLLAALEAADGGAYIGSVLGDEKDPTVSIDGCFSLNVLRERGVIE